MATGKPAAAIGHALRGSRGPARDQAGEVKSFVDNQFDSKQSL
ncbi:protein of unknown function [Rhodovastum atsumiense]|nr:protein of unknown function [Rhodovastum atsumiense]